MESLEFVQRFVFDSVCLPPTCDADGCASRAVGLWQNKEHKAWCLCEKHRNELNAEPMMEGVLYLPTKSMMKGYVWRGGKAVHVG